MFDFSVEIFNPASRLRSPLKRFVTHGEAHEYAREIKRAFRIAGIEKQLHVTVFFEPKQPAYNREEIYQDHA